MAPLEAQQPVTQIHPSEVTLLCIYCHEEAEEGGNLHPECQIRLVIGSVAHILKRCGCYVPGSIEGDPPHLTIRQAAIAAVKIHALRERRN